MNRLLAEIVRFLVIVPGVLAQALLTTTLSPGLPQMAAAFGGGRRGEFLASIAFTSGSLGLMLAGFGSGWLCARSAPRSFMIVFLAIMAAAGSAGLVLVDPIVIIASRIIAGMAACALATAGMAFLNMQYSQSRRPAMIGYQTAFGSAAAITALLAAGQLVGHAGWHASFALYLIFLPVLGLVPAMPRTVAPVLHEPGEQSAPTATWTAGPIFMMAVLLYLLVVIPGVQGPYLLQMNGIHSAGIVSAVVGLAPLLASVVALRYGAFDRRLGAARSFQLSLFSGAAGLLLLATAHGLPGAALGMAAYGFAIGFWTPYIVEEIMRRNLHASSFGVLIAAFSLGIFLNPVAFATLNAISGLRASLAICAAGLAIGGTVSVVRSIGQRR